MRLPSLALCALLLAGCGGKHVSFSGDLNYGKTAEDDYNAGVEELSTKSYPEATRFFEHVRTKYPFSRFAALSELRLADAKYEQDHFVEAADAYRQFIKLHPNHEEAGYAAWRIGLSYWRDGPSDFFLVPPPQEKDLGQVREAKKALDEFLKSYPSSKYRPDAEKVMAAVKRVLADHEWYVAQFYVKRGHWPAVAGRLETLLREYPGSGRDPEALLALAGAFVKLDERYRAQQALQQLIVKYPEDPHRGQAEKMLASLR